MFSAVIPLFNKRRWIRRALDSIASQEFPCAEVIVVNDGSTDASEAAAREWDDPRLRIIDQPNRGASAARNTGIAAATQPFVAFLDSDDEWTPTFLARMRSLIEAHPGAVLYGAGFMTVAGGRHQRNHGVSGTLPTGGPIDFFHEIAHDHVVNASSIVVPAQAALAVGGFPPGVPYLEDYVFFVSLALTGQVVLTPEPLVRYDMGIPGQAHATWRNLYSTSLDATALDHVIAAHVHRLSGRAALTPPESSFMVYARRHLTHGVLTRIYRGRFDAVDRFRRDLRLDEVPLGWMATAAGWVAGSPLTRPLLRAILAVARPARRSLVRGLRRWSG